MQTVTCKMTLFKNPLKLKPGYYWVMSTWYTPLNALTHDRRAEWALSDWKMVESSLKLARWSRDTGAESQGDELYWGPIPTPPKGPIQNWVFDYLKRDNRISKKQCRKEGRAHD